MLLADTVCAFPSNVRLGYTTCAACHVNPSGGGVLTPYGRMSSAELMSTWGKKDEAELLHGLINTSDNLDIGGDFQHVSYNLGGYEDEFVMQRELEVAVNFRRKFFIAVSSGLYGREPEAPEMRRTYLMATNLWDNWTLKLGRFFPAFGIMSSEHLYLYRSRYFNQGRETYNAEVMFRNKLLELTATKIFGHPEDFHNGYLKGKEGFSTRLNVMPTKSLTLGASYLLMVDPYSNLEHYGAVHALWGVSKALWLESQITDKDAYLRVGIPTYKGLLLRPTAQVEYESEDPAKVELNIQWMPRPHFDFQLTCSKTTWIFLSHYYL